LADGATPRVLEDDIGRTFREEFGRSVAALVRAFGDIDVAEDAVQEAFAIALEKWPVEGLPPNPGGWITTTAKNVAMDRRRRETRSRDVLSDVARISPDPEVREMIDDPGTLEDDRLCLIFMCCHPALAAEAQVALTLRLFGGLTTEDVARSLLVAESTMAQRLVRVKHKIKAARIPYRVPEGSELTERLRPVLSVVYLIYNAGAGSPKVESEDDLCGEALRLARLLAELLPGESEVAGLLALLLLTESRRDARFDGDGALVLLRDQARARWSRALIDEGQAIVRECLRRGEPGPYQIQAAINAVHADAGSIEGTDWSQIVALYDQLLAVSPTPVVALNRAIAIAEVDGPAAGLELVEALDLEHYGPYHATRADLLRRLGRHAEARAAYGVAASLAATVAEREFLLMRASSL